MEFLNKKQKTILIIVATLMLIFIGYYIIKKTEYSNYDEIEIIEENNIETNGTSNKENEEILDEKIVVHITGEVINNGIVKVNKGARIADVIEEAGGATEEANISEVNLAYQVSDGQKIYIPNINENQDQNSSGEYITNEAGNSIIKEEKATVNEKVNINTATQTQLETLSGIGPSTALKIINYRNENGDFKTIEDLKNVPGIGDIKFENIKESICVK